MEIGSLFQLLVNMSVEQRLNIRITLEEGQIRVGDANAWGTRTVKPLQGEIIDALRWHLEHLNIKEAQPHA